MDVFEQLESEVRSYCRGWPVVFDRAVGSRLWDVDQNSYLDFFSGAGALNYGHNNPAVKKPLLEYLGADRVIHSLDMSTVAKAEFLQAFQRTILGPRGLDYKVQFPGPTGTNAVEAALKLARKVTGREHVVSFTNAFHGMTLGALSVTGNSMKRNGAGVPLNHGTALPYCGFLGDDVDSMDILEALLIGSGSGLDEPAAVILETVQGEGGINVASPRWLRRVAEVCERHGILLIVDDIQMGCGRTGTFFSFEEAGIVPDIVTLSKSLSGSGLPLAVTLFKRELDVWSPGEHNGTFRGNNPAFVTATAALEFWRDDALTQDVLAKGETVRGFLDALAAEYDGYGIEVRGRGLIWGLAFDDSEVARRICQEAFARGLLVETSGPESEVVKLMPPLTVSVDDELKPGLAILGEAVDATLNVEVPVVAGGAR
ncbi:MAG TPA: diaminobutyrate--2-oxoglutarate transaminase [Mycobacteriales bacterium]|jgi:diaminobutyrate-2-oxoglutarate transaminase|nr:diaminobutyrate--2-oxoglutarate transaminase [Mycobacteriales bacterium]